MYEFPDVTVFTSDPDRNPGGSGAFIMRTKGDCYTWSFTCVGHTTVANCAVAACLLFAFVSGILLFQTPPATPQTRKLQVIVVIRD